MTNRPFPVDATLTAIAIAYKNDTLKLINNRALPPLPVHSELFGWHEYPLGQALTVPDLEVGRLGQVGQTTFRVEERDSRIRDFGQDTPIPQTDIDEAAKQRRDNKSTFDPIHAGTMTLTNLVDLGREIRAAQVVQNPDNYTASRKIAISNAADKFSNYETSDPYGVLNDGMRKPLIHRANTIAMGEAVWEVLKRNPRLIKAVKGGLAEDGAISRQQFAELMEIDLDRLLIGVSVVNTARPGQPVELSPVWGNSIEMLFIDHNKKHPKDGLLTWGFTAELETKMAGTIIDPDMGLKGGLRVRVGERVREVVCAKDLGYLIQTPI